ncbi:MAG: DUF1553 domain-containing protein [Planctomycetaceae bacterium]
MPAGADRSRTRAWHCWTTWLLISLLGLGSTGGLRAQEPAAHWAYRPLARASVELPQGANHLQSAIDARLQVEFDRAGIQPAGPVDRGALFRRLHFDLWGLPPDPAEQRAFEADEAPEAIARLVERLLADPRFGQRWGRHWLDLSRFAESLTLRGFVFPNAWRYRDYVIDSFNQDLPYAQFVTEQLAGDLLEGGTLEERQRRLIATTVLMLGNTNLEEQDKKQLEMDVVDDQIDWLGTALLGQTLACARCHDHKFDPVSIRDYYGLAGIFKGAQALAHENVSKWLEIPLPLTDDEEAQWRSREEVVRVRQSELAEAKKLLAAAIGESNAQEMVPVASLPGVVVDDDQAKKVGEWRQSSSVKPFVGRGYLHDLDAGKGEKSLTFQPEIKVAGEYEVRLAYTPGDNRTARAPVTIFSADGERTVEIDQRQPPPIDRLFISLGRHRFEANGAGHVLVGTANAPGHVVADAVQFLPVDSADFPPATAAPTVTDEQRQALRGRVTRAEQAFKAAQANLAGRPKVMTVQEQGSAADLPVHLRGSVQALGEVVPRGVPQFASNTGLPLPLAIPPGTSGRRQLAAWLTDPGNPLPYRVYVNRVWGWLLGRGLVASVDNLGTTGTPPSHPALLDELALGFLANGQSTKWLVRQIVLSAVYARSSEVPAEVWQHDPDNQLWARRPPRRLQAEELRDSLLWATGELSGEMRGPGFDRTPDSDYGFQSDSRRRSLYLPQFRNATPRLVEVFDCVDSSRVVGARNTSTVAPQALALLNDPFVETRLQVLATQLASEPSRDLDAGLNRACHRLWGREPTPPERLALRSAFEKLDTQAADARWLWLLQVLVNSLEFRYLR